MKTLLAVIILLTLSAGVSGVAQAKPVPVEPVRLMPAPDETAIAVGPAAAMLESDYFRAPQTPIASGRVFPCRLHLQVFDKTQLAQTCH